MAFKSHSPDYTSYVRRPGLSMQGCSLPLPASGRPGNQSAKRRKREGSSRGCTASERASESVHSALHTRQEECMQRPRSHSSCKERGREEGRVGGRGHPAAGWLVGWCTFSRPLRTLSLSLSPLSPLSPVDRMHFLLFQVLLHGCLLLARYRRRASSLPSCLLSLIRAYSILQEPRIIQSGWASS